MVVHSDGARTKAKDRLYLLFGEVPLLSKPETFSRFCSAAFAVAAASSRCGLLGTLSCRRVRFSPESSFSVPNRKPCALIPS